MQSTTLVKKKRKPIISDTSTENDRPNHNHNESTVPVHSKSNKNKKKNVVEPATKTEPLKHSDKSMKSADDIDIDHVDDFIFKRQPVNTTQSINNQENMTSTQLSQGQPQPPGYNPYAAAAPTGAGIPLQ